MLHGEQVSSLCLKVDKVIRVAMDGRLQQSNLQAFTVEWP